MIPLVHSLITTPGIASTFGTEFFYFAKQYHGIAKIWLCYLRILVDIIGLLFCAQVPVVPSSQLWYVMNAQQRVLRFPINFMKV